MKKKTEKKEKQDADPPFGLFQKFYNFILLLFPYVAALNEIDGNYYDNAIVLLSYFIPSLDNRHSKTTNGTEKMKKHTIHTKVWNEKRFRQTFSDIYYHVTSIRCLEKAVINTISLGKGGVRKHLRFESTVMYEIS